MPMHEMLLLNYFLVKLNSGKFCKKVLCTLTCVRVTPFAILTKQKSPLFLLSDIASMKMSLLILIILKLQIKKMIWNKYMYLSII